MCVYPPDRVEHPRSVAMDASQGGQFFLGGIDLSIGANEHFGGLVAIHVGPDVESRLLTTGGALEDAAEITPCGLFDFKCRTRHGVEFDVRCLIARFLEGKEEGR